ncbi:hypothetical protein TIFTF001_038806 [Ficus carica]|uniref:Uncharacterized protein n=1 Tax=Ficus carica TaxID=3494 RepID=A0AA88E8E5_FICCA|nr:hypothetical protein TIFTF001_038806 [Ficus carica]
MSSSLDLEIKNTISQADLDYNHGKEEADQEEDEEEDPQESFSYVTQLMGSTATIMSLNTVAELEVFDIIAKAGRGAPSYLRRRSPPSSPTTTRKRPLCSTASFGSSPATLC